MKISSIINKLQKIQEEIGDIDVYITVRPLSEAESEPLFADWVDISTTIGQNNRPVIQFYELPF